MNTFREAWSFPEGLNANRDAKPQFFRLTGFFFYNNIVLIILKGDFGLEIKDLKIKIYGEGSKKR